jgi:hypothetical protein
MVAGCPIISAYTHTYLMGGGRAPATASAASAASSTPCADLDGEEGLTAAGPRPVVLLGGGGACDERSSIHDWSVRPLNVINTWRVAAVAAEAELVEGGQRGGGRGGGASDVLPLLLLLLGLLAI